MYWGPGPPLLEDGWISAMITFLSNIKNCHIGGNPQFHSMNWNPARPDIPA
jgi:hypothetical protein